MTSCQRVVLDEVARHPGGRASDIGQAVWGRRDDHRGVGSHGHNKYCRVAGKVLRSLEKLGLVEWSPVYGSGGKGYVSWTAK